MYHETLSGRRNIFKVFRAWLAGERLSSGAISTDGRDIYSYGACILATADDGTVLLNDEHYSPTTTRHQRGVSEGLRRFAPALKPVTVTPPHGSNTLRADTLRAAA